jgi:hypothetical protein
LPFRLSDPELSVKEPLNEMVLFIVTPLALFIVRLFKEVTLDGIVIPVELPPKTKLDEEVVDKFAGVPAMAGPLRVRELAPIGNVPDVRVKVPFNVSELFAVTPFALFIVRLFKEVTLEGIDIPAELPPKTRLDVEVVDKLVGVPAIAGPLIVRVFPAMANIPDVNVSKPLTVIDPPSVLVPAFDEIKFV